MAIPVLQNQVPAPDAKHVDVASNVYLELVEAVVGLNAASVILTVNGVVAWSGDAQQAGFVVTKTPITNGFSYDINPDTDFPAGQASRVDVYAEDTGAVPLSTFYVFETEGYLLGTNADQVGFEDVATFPTAGGPDKHVAPDTGVGQRIPGPPHQPVGSVGPFDSGAYEDAQQFHTAGGPAQHQAPEDYALGTGQALPGPAGQEAAHPSTEAEQGAFEDALTLPTADGRPHHAFDDDTRVGVPLPGSPLEQEEDHPAAELAGFEDRLIYELDADQDVEYTASKQDTDGNDFLGGYSLTSVVLVDTTQGGFGNPVTENHWGVARDGKRYADGVEVLSTGYGFGTLADGFNLAAWSMSGQEPFAQEDGTTVFALTGDDQLRIQGTWPAWAVQGGIATSQYKWCIGEGGGDFDIQVDFSNYIVNAGSEGESRLAVFARVPSLQQFYVNRDAGGQYRTARVINDGYASLGTVGTSDTSGKLRITRVAGVLTGYKWNGSSWDQVGATYTHANLSGALCVNVGSTGNNNTNTDITYSNFVVNSGTVYSTGGWYREASGTHRGVQPSMPTTLAVCCSAGSIDLIDVTNDKLWMRFLQGTNNAFDNWDARIAADYAFFQDGVLVVALSAYPHAEEGGLLVIDFVRDEVRIHRHAAATITGGYYNGTLLPQGAILTRNDGKDWSGDFAEWAVQDRRVQGCAVIANGGLTYRAAATFGGISVFKQTRGYTQEVLKYAQSTETTLMRFCEFDEATGNLLYVDDSSVYEATQADMDAGLAGGFGNTFGATTVKALPSWAWQPAHFRLHRYNTNYLYMPRAEGIYKVNWPGGSFVHEYGKAGSGAVHAILPDHHSLNDITLAQDGATDLLLVDLLISSDTGQSQVVAIKLSDHTIYAVSKLFTKNLAATGMAA